MKKDFISRPSGSEKNEPKVIGEVLNKYFQSNEPLAVAYRNHLYPDTHLCVDLKVYSRTQGRMPVDAYIDGVLTRNGEDRFTFVQNDAEKKKLMVTQRNPHIYVGKRINVNRKTDGTLYPTFNRPRYSKDFSFQDFCREAAEELLVVAGLVKE